MGLTPDNDTVTTPPLTDAAEQWCEMTVEWSLDGDSTAPQPTALAVARAGCTYDPGNPATWALCHTPGCGDELEAYSGRFTDGTMDFDVVRCPSCGYEAHV